MANERTKIQHLYLRAAFGAKPKEIDDLATKPLDKVVDDLFEASAKFKQINYLPYPLNEKEQKKGAGGIKMVKLFIKSFAEMEKLNEQWIFKLTHTKASLRDKMVFFWHNHFSTSVPYGYLMQEQNNLIRTHALGKFGDLIHAISKDPAMIIYLNNQQNVKGHPNENFAREVMELFTLGIGNYTEKDIKEAARAFTGWAVTNTGEFIFKEKQHDNDSKEFMGKTGNFGGEDIINMLLENKQTARYIVSKIYKEFVNQNLPNERLEKLSEQFYNSQYDIEDLMKTIFKSDWFYEDENIGVKICSPVEFIVRLKKYLEVEFTELKYLINYQKALGQVLFFPPNVAGWKGHTTWIDSASLLLRLNTINFIKEDGLSLDINGKPAFEKELEDKRSNDQSKKLSAKWDELIDYCENKTAQELIDCFIQTEKNHIDLKLFEGLSAQDKIVQLFTLPEFQLI